jgi:radical SAM superfamily enzyme YgiQ (UPF0313 family)
MFMNPPQSVVPQERMDIDLPGYAWDLLPYRERPLDMYRAHFWHAGFDHSKRTPFAAIYTSLGCNFGCDFCMINIVNRVDEGDDVHAANSRGMRFWSPTFIAGELEKLARMGVETVRISDEMFFLLSSHMEAKLRDAVTDSQWDEITKYRVSNNQRWKKLVREREEQIGELELQKPKNHAH